MTICADCKHRIRPRLSCGGAWQPMFDICKASPNDFTDRVAGTTVIYSRCEVVNDGNCKLYMPTLGKRFEDWLNKRNTR